MKPMEMIEMHVGSTLILTSESDDDADVHHLKFKVTIYMYESVNFLFG